MVALARDLGRAGARVTQVEHTAAALTHVRRDANIAAILCDISQDIAGLARALNAERIAAKLVAIGLDPSPQQATEAMAAGARDVMGLPAEPALLAALLDAASGEPGAPVVRDPIMLALLRRAEQIAASDASVLITGESGTGKEVLARLIHKHSRRSNGPFVALNCAAIPENLLESELFGHEKGAFSGALARRIGKFEAADGGTLLLDEISEMELRLQAKLLRALQEREIDRVGGNAPVRVNVRILATSNRDLPAEAAAGRFREDLYFRLNVVGLRIPPLRERPGDIPALADHFAHRYADINGLAPRPVSPTALLMLGAQHWRGNVRELENTMHRAVILAEGAEIGPDAIELPGGRAPGPAIANGENFIGRRMEEVERDHILHTLSHTLGNRTHAATMLGISIRALRNKLKDYAQAGIQVPPPQAGVAA
ncbi:MAG TPA: sigma-54 dependent transcriptional regulator [Acetobacteraceae bacterium]|nr:sigma-54 dependent transcriptional regulator [Acetobacteraceae bacterium]